MFPLFRQFDDSFCSSRPNTMKSWAGVPAAAHKSTQTPWLPSDVLPVALCSNTDEEGVSLIFLHPLRNNQAAFSAVRTFRLNKQLKCQIEI